MCACSGALNSVLFAASYALAHLRLGRIDLRADARHVGDEVLHLALFAVRVLRLVRLVVRVDFGRRDGDRRASRATPDRGRSGSWRSRDVRRYSASAAFGETTTEFASALSIFCDRDLAREVVFEIGGV